MTNNVIRAIYAYRYDGGIEHLRVEEGKSEGFELWSLERILNLDDGDRKKIIPGLCAGDALNIFRKIQEFVG